MDSTLEAVRTGATVVGKLATEHAVAHPYHTAFTGLSLGLTPFLGAGWLTAPILKVIGFGPLGPIAGSAAAWYQSTWFGAYIPAGSFFAWCQQLAMGSNGSAAAIEGMAGVNASYDGGSPVTQETFE